MRTFVEFVEQMVQDVADPQHLVCCRDENRALCGADASDLPWEDRPTTCLGCRSVETSDRCPVDGRHCPYNERHHCRPRRPTP